MPPAAGFCCLRLLARFGGRSASSLEPISYHYRRACLLIRRRWNLRFAFAVKGPAPPHQLHGNGLLETGWSLPSANREKRNGRSSSLSLPTTSSATSLPTPIIL